MTVAEDDYRDKSPAAGRVGKAIEYLVAASCILVTGGELNVSTSDLTNDPLPPAKAHSASVGRV